MKTRAIQVAIALYAVTVNAVHIPFSQVKRPGNERRPPSGFGVVTAASGLNLTTVHDLIYMANVTIGGVDYPVQLDTGSSDLWVQNSSNPSTPLPNVNQISTTYNLTYGIGWAFGHIAFAPVTFANITVANQALLAVSQSVNPALQYGAAGLLGLGFTSLSTIDHVLNGTGSSAGRSLLYNLFEENPSEPNFIAFSLQRSLDPDGTVEGLFSIGEYDPQYAAVADRPRIPTWPVHAPKRWNVHLEALLIGDRTVIPNTTVQNAPGAIALLDSGTSYSYAPEEVCAAIYGDVPGARFVPALGQWTVPCDAEIDMALQFGGQVFPVHPLDVTPVSLSSRSTCVGSFLPQSIAIGAGEFDWLIGDNFLRSVYSIYDFGDFDSSGNMADPYVKLFPLVEPNTASAEFHQDRGGVPRTNITYNAANTTSAGPAPTAVSLTKEAVDNLNKIGTFLPAIMGIMALNAIVLILLVIVGIVFLCRGRTKKGRTPRGRKSPIAMNRSSQNSLRAQPHAYEPVSMALTDDTVFTPPSPGFRKFGGVDRPKSSLNRVSMAQPEDTPFTPPSPSSPPPNGRPISVLPSSDAPPSPTDDLLIPPSPSYHSFDDAAQKPPSRPASVVSQTVGVALTDDAVVNSPSRAPLHFDNQSLRPDSRPLSSASRVSQHIGIALTDGPVVNSTPRVSVSSEQDTVQPDDPRSSPSQFVGVTLTDRPVIMPPRARHRFESREIRLGDRPSSFAYPPPPMSPQDTLAPPSPLFRSSDRPRSMA